MKDQLELINALLAGKQITNDCGDRLEIINGNIYGTDMKNVRYPVKWLDPAIWKFKA